MLEHGVHDDEELAHAGGEGDLGGFALAAQVRVEGSYDGVASHGRDGSHVERSAHLGAPTPDDALALMLAAVAAEGGHADQRGDLPARERPEFRQQRKEGGAGERANAGDGLEQIVFVAPGLGGAKRVREVDVESTDALVQPGDVLAQAGSLECGGALDAQLLLHTHLDELATTSQHLAEGAGVLVRELAHLRADGRGEGRQDECIDAIGLGQAAAGLRVVAHLTGVDDGHGQTGRRKRAGNGGFEAAGGLHHHERGRCREQSLDQAGNGFVGVVDSKRLPREPGDIESVLGDVDAEERIWVVHSGTLHCKNPGSKGPDQLFGLQEHPTRRPALTCGLVGPRLQRAAGSATAGATDACSTADSSAESVV